MLCVSAGDLVLICDRHFMALFCCVGLNAAKVCGSSPVVPVSKRGGRAGFRSGSRQAALFQFLGGEWLLGGLNAVGATILGRIGLEATDRAGRAFHGACALLWYLLGMSARRFGAGLSPKDRENQSIRVVGALPVLTWFLAPPRTPNFSANTAARTPTCRLA